jgi:hypothetical protein
VQATVADNLIAQDPLRRRNSAAFESLAALFAGVAVALLVAATPPVPVRSGPGRRRVWPARSVCCRPWSVGAAAPTIAVATAVAAMTLARSIGDRRRADSAGRQKTNAQRLMVRRCCR